MNNQTDQNAKDEQSKNGNSYFDDAKNVEAYVKMAKGYDGRELIELMREHLESGASVLELGMGPGVDFELLSEHYRVTGSDYSQLFLDRYREKNADVDLIQLDAVSMNTERRFDAIYSNKVLHHLTRSELKKSFQRQAGTLNDGGLLFHSFWYGEGEEEHHGLRFVSYTEESLTAQIGREFKTIEMSRYTEMSQEDSLFLILQKRR